MATLATKALLYLTDTLDIQQDFLSTNPQQWYEETYMEACHCSEGLHISNYMVERGVSYFQSLTHERLGERIPPPAHGATLTEAVMDSQVQSYWSKMVPESELAMHETPPLPPLRANTSFQ